ncbi:MAG: hypothetical protein ACREU4_11075 [Burkholderiales bacterium]
MTHAEFVAAYREGRLQVQVDREGAARHVSARLMLPIVLLPLLGVAVAAALVGHYIVGALLFVGALALRYAVRRTAPGFVLQRALADERFYADARASGLLK